MQDKILFDMKIDKHRDLYDLINNEKWIDRIVELLWLWNEDFNEVSWILIMREQLMKIFKKELDEYDLNHIHIINKLFSQRLLNLSL